MQLHFFTIPIHHHAAATAELNRFLAGHKIIELERVLVQDGGNSAWSVCVGIEEGADEPSASGNRRQRVDYKEILNEADFIVYSRLRDLRKQLAEADGVPVYTVFTNEQMSAMVQGRVSNIAALAAIAGVGPARVEKYGQAFLTLLAEVLVTSAPSDTDQP